MSVVVRIPSQLRSLTAGEAEVQLDGVATAGEVLSQVASVYPELRERIFDTQGNVRRFVNIFVRDEDIRFLEGLETAVGSGDVVSIVPAVAGG
ncbi:MAG: MoaD/ThiS family protein [Ferrimicrobium sp.]